MNRKAIIATLSTARLPIVISFNNILEKSLVPINTKIMNDNIIVASTRSLFIFMSVFF